MCAVEFGHLGFPYSCARPVALSHSPVHNVTVEGPDGGAGLLGVPDAVWVMAVPRAEVIAPLPAVGTSCRCSAGGTQGRSALSCVGGAGGGICCGDVEAFACA